MNILDQVETELADLLIRQPDSPRIKELQELRMRLRPPVPHSSVSSRDYCGEEIGKIFKQ